MNFGSPFLEYKIDHRLEQQRYADDLTIIVETEIVRHDSGSTKKSSFSFSSNEFVEDEYSLNKEKLYYFLTEAGIDEDNDAQFMINDMILSFCDLPFLKNKRFRGVWEVFLYVRFPSNEKSTSTSTSSVTSCVTLA
ncbi:hypothetical protein Bca52824_032809 [Brassica carinata]|uniref:Uncharacterized protein n=1 Tax=Brassica carinata TaxID=52824 RepID=A0A8X7SDF6_BRACI|nr:hypothetical protein Bca52824_032809 [Brassica carinata]